MLLERGGSNPSMGIANRLRYAPHDYEQGYEPSKLDFQIRDKIITRVYRGEISGTVNLGSCIYGPMARYLASNQRMRVRFPLDAYEDQG